MVESITTKNMQDFACARIIGLNHASPVAGAVYLRMDESIFFLSLVAKASNNTPFL